MVAPCREVVLSWKWMVFQSGSNLLVDNILQFPTSRWWVNRTILVSRLVCFSRDVKHSPKPAGDEILISYLSGEDGRELSGLWLIDLQVDRGSQILVYYAFHMLSIWFCSQMLGPQPGLPST